MGRVATQKEEKNIFVQEVIKFADQGGRGIYLYVDTNAAWNDSQRKCVEKDCEPCGRVIT